MIAESYACIYDVFCCVEIEVVVVAAASAVIIIMIIIIM